MLLTFSEILSFPLETSAYVDRFVLAFAPTSKVQDFRSQSNIEIQNKMNVLLNKSFSESEDLKIVLCDEDLGRDHHVAV